MVDKKLKVKCPHCKKEFAYYSSEYRPFCCERCKMVALGHWSSDSFSIASSEPLEERDVEQVIEHLEEQGEDNE